MATTAKIAKEAKTPKYKIRGMDIIICTTAKTNDEARELLRSFGLPFTA